MGRELKIYSSDYWNELYISINGTNNNDFEITCYKQHDCTIICSDSCNIILNCDGNCTLIGNVTKINHSNRNQNESFAWEIVGIVVAVIGLCILVVFCMYKTNKKRKLKQMMNAMYHLQE